MKTSNLSADNFKKVLDLDGSTPEPAIRSGDTGQRIPCFDSCQLITTLMCNQFPPGLPKRLESVKVNIGFPVVRADGWRAVGVRAHDYAKCACGAPLKYREIIKISYESKMSKISN